MTKISSHSPCRVDLAGGTLDIWPLYLYLKDAVTVNFAVNRFTRCEIHVRTDERIQLRSLDQESEETFDSFEDLADSGQYRLPLASYALRFFRPRTGLNVTTTSEAPAGAGISGSSSLLITMTAALNELNGCGYDLEQLRQISQNIEAQIIQVPTGAQDYYPALYGGVGAVELRTDAIRRTALGVDAGELNQRTVLAYTGVPRNSGINNWEVTKAFIDGDQQVIHNFERIAAIASAMRNAIEKPDWAEVGRLLRAEWSNRRTNAPGITTPLIDHLIDSACRAGALGAKVCGAGGGGCVFFLTEPDAKERVAALIRDAGGTVLPVEVAPQGVQVQISQD